MARFFVGLKDIDIKNNNIVLIGENFHHLKNVLRLKVGDSIVVCDGNQNDFISIIQSINKENVKLNIIKSEINNREPNLDLVLYQSVPKSDKMDFIVQKAVELGVKRIVPFISERTIVKLKTNKDAEKKVDRWQKIATEAAKQSQRGIIPYIDQIVPLKTALLDSLNSDISILPYEKNNTGNFRSIFTKSEYKSISVLIGPEGGFELNEIQSASDIGIKIISLGPRILRTETAGVVCSAILLNNFGDIL